MYGLSASILCNSLQLISTHCISYPLTATHISSLQLISIHCNSHTMHILSCSWATCLWSLQHTATHCNSLQLTATHCNSLQLTRTHWSHCNSLQLICTVLMKFIPKLWFEIAMVLSTNSGSFLSNLHVFATFSFWIHSGKIWNLGISNKLWYIQCWRKGRILINLCGKTDVRNCDLLQRDFFCSVKDSPMGGKGFFLECVVKLGKKWGPETLWFYSH